MTTYSNAALTRLELYRVILDRVSRNNEETLHEALVPAIHGRVLVGIVVRDETGTYTLSVDEDGNVDEVKSPPVLTTEQRAAAWEEAKASRNFATVTDADINAAGVRDVVADVRTIKAFHDDLNDLNGRWRRFLQTPFPVTEPVSWVPDLSLASKASEHEDFLLHADPDTLPKTS